MSRLLIFIFIASLGVFAIVALFAIRSESWHEDYPHKMQYGLFPFWQTVDDGRAPKKSSSRLLYGGLMETALAGTSVLLFVYMSWGKLLGATLERNCKTDHREV
jgi:hypothetical protein